MVRTMLAATLAFSSAGIAFAGDGLSPLNLAHHIFTKADANKDGVLTAKEHQSAGLGRYGVSFVDFDLDDDNKVSWEEYKSVFERHHKAPGERDV